MDVDGTIADESARRLAAAGPDGALDDADYDAYFDPGRVAADTPIPEALATLRALSDSGVKILYVTARPAEICQATASWIGRHGFPPGPVRCRPKFGRTAQYKTDVIRRLAREHRIVAGVGQEERDGEPYRAAGIEGVYVAENDDTGWRETVRPALLRAVTAAEAER